MFVLLLSLTLHAQTTVEFDPGPIERIIFTPVREYAASLDPRDLPQDNTQCIHKPLYTTIVSTFEASCPIDPIQTTCENSYRSIASLPSPEPIEGVPWTQLINHRHTLAINFNKAKDLTLSCSDSFHEYLWTPSCSKVYSKVLNRDFIREIALICTPEMIETQLQDFIEYVHSKPLPRLQQAHSLNVANTQKTTELFNHYNLIDKYLKERGIK